MRLSKGQKLLTMQEVDGGSCSYIRRQPHGRGYCLEGHDSHLGINFYFPLSQDEVAEYFKAFGKEWKYE